MMEAEEGKPQFEIPRDVYVRHRTTCIDEYLRQVTVSVEQCCLLLLVESGNVNLIRGKQGYDFCCFYLASEVGDALFYLVAHFCKHQYTVDRAENHCLLNRGSLYWLAWSMANKNGGTMAQPEQQYE